ncbi:unnamed protein product [Didymodactylos carnosus]|uniref:Uncharacterized protein n=1 Tax=Didymodactylos carnosus TaxID=1234261 RepID=A0A8S2DMR0_9BILA|nr:unnamed protein product [Didymodactylos carnosus]CAF3706867.1 unnamed protein product [Didymodactylos carnosus]
MNLKPEQLKAMKKLKEDKEVIVVAAYKGGKAVALDVEDYKKKVKNKLDTDTYQVLRKDPSAHIYKELSKLVTKLKQNSLISKRQAKTFLKQKRLPIVRAQVKVHKAGYPVRCSSLFTSIDKNKALEILKQVLEDDDIWMADSSLTKENKDQINDLVAYLNKIAKNNIQFTSEFENESKLPFLDVLIKVDKEKHKFKATWYRKPTAAKSHYERD